MGRQAGTQSRSAREGTHAAALEFQSVQRVTAFLDAEADAAPSPFLCALWRKLAANTRLELDPGACLARDPTSDVAAVPAV